MYKGGDLMFEVPHSTIKREKVFLILGVRILSVHYS